MNLDEIQPNLDTIIKALPALAAVAAHILIDDGSNFKVSEQSLTGEGLAIVIMPPQAIGLSDQVKGRVALDYASTIWVRTNPKIKVAGVAKWNPLTLEAAIIPAVLAFKDPSTLRFRIPPGLEPESDFTDTGNNSRLIRFETPILL
jgi:hypothetical protein